MKKALPFFVLLMLSLLIVACGGSDSDTVAVSIGLTQTATAPTEVVAEVAPEPAKGVISGVAGLMAPPTPPLTIYAVNTINGEWVSVDTPESEMETSFSIEVPPGTYQVFAFPPGLAYSADNTQLSTITVNAGETVADIRLAIPGPSDCGPMFSIPASPDGKHAEIVGATADCLAEASAPEASAPVESELIAIQFASGDTSTQVFGTLPAGGINHYVLGASAGQEMTVSLDAFDGNSTTLAIYGTDRTILNQYDSTSPLWIGTLPSTQQYYIDILSPENVDIDYALVVSVTTPAQTNNNTGDTDVPDTDVPGGIAGSINYPEATSPEIHIVATDRATGLWYWVPFAENSGSYTMPELSPGSYLISAYTQGGLAGGYVDGNGSFLPVMVGAAELVDGINLSWWTPNGNEVDPTVW